VKYVNFSDTDTKKYRSERYVIIDAFVGRTYQRRPKSAQQQMQEIKTPTQDN
jgi:hypothetical protein